jgi:hypothetical protein
MPRFSVKGSVCEPPQLPDFDSVVERDKSGRRSTNVACKRELENSHRKSP